MLLKSFVAANLILLAKTLVVDNETTTVDFDFNEFNDGNTTDNINTDNDTISTTVTPTCGIDQWQCADFGCVDLKQKCDGALHCEDGSDETRANCNEIQRPMLGLMLYCIADRAYLKDGVCPDICKEQSEYCAYALLAEQITAPEGVCALPDFPQHGSYKVTKLNGTENQKYKDFSVDFECEYGKELIGDPKQDCINGTWSDLSSESPKCSDTCELKKNSKYTYTCIRDGRNKTCGDFVAIGSEVVIAKWDKKISNSSIEFRTSCTENQILNTSDHCVQELDTFQKKFESETLNNLSQYENKFKERDYPSTNFNELVTQYRIFEQRVTNETQELSINIAVCGINLDVMVGSS